MISKQILRTSKNYCNYRRVIQTVKVVLERVAILVLAWEATLAHNKDVTKKYVLLSDFLKSSFINYYVLYLEKKYKLIFHKKFHLYIIIVLCYF